MDALVVYESMFGNTSRIANAIGQSLARHGLAVTVAGIDDVEDRAIPELLVVGGPTHAHGLSTTSTRATAVADRHNTFDEPTMGTGLRAWLSSMPDGQARAAAAFDTRIGGAPRWATGSAARRIGDLLGEHGYRLVLDPESFLVTRHNEMVDGEPERAGVWAEGLAGALRAIR
jgi:hypothetical protein